MFSFNRLRNDLLSCLQEDELKKIQQQEVFFKAIKRCNDLLRQLQLLQFTSLYDQYWKLYKDLVSAMVQGLQNIPEAPQKNGTDLFPGDLLFADRLNACSLRLPGYGQNDLGREFYCKCTEDIGILEADIANYLKNYTKHHYTTRLDLARSLILRWSIANTVGSILIIASVIFSLSVGISLTKCIQTTWYRHSINTYLKNPSLDIFLPETYAKPFGSLCGAKVEEDGTSGKPFAWGMGPRTLVSFYCLQKVPLLLNLALSNPIPGQTVQLFINGELVRTYSNLPRVAWLVPAISEEIPFESKIGKNVITLRYTYWNHFNTVVTKTDSRPFAVAITQFNLSPAPNSTARSSAKTSQ